MGSSFYDRISENKRNSNILVFMVFAITFALVYVFSYIFLGEGPIGFFISAFFAVIYIAITYSFADRFVLAVAGAREPDQKQNAYLINCIDNISIAAGIPSSKPYIIDDPALNAFAVGKPGNSAIAVTSGLLSTLNRAELEGVIAHEVSHIKNYDSRMGALVVVMIGLIAILSDIGLRSLFWGKHGGSDRRGGGGGAIMLVGLVIMILAPIAAQLVRLAISRQREYLADATGAQLTRYPEGLAGALEKISKASVVQRASDASASLYIANPLSMAGMFSTHPPIDERIKRLRAM
jgi:heat shock protein HtpX